jgi:COP9 signalosome complex subunit 4
MHAVIEWSLQLRYSVTLARVLDSNRKFVDAALRYYELSTTQNKMVSPLPLPHLIPPRDCSR